MSKEKKKRKFLKNIYQIQESFDVPFSGVSRTFSFGIIPTDLQKQKLEKWFGEVSIAKQELYDRIYSAFKKNTKRFFEKGFTYDTFFKGSGVFKKISNGRETVTSSPVGQGLRMEINGAIRSFITNHQRIFDENTIIIGENLKTIKGNESLLQKENLKLDFAVEDLEKKMQQFLETNHIDIVASFNSYSDAEKLVKEIIIFIGDYNYELNQIRPLFEKASHRKDLSILRRPRRLPRFPATNKEEGNSTEQCLKAIKEYCKASLHKDTVFEHITRFGELAQKSERRKNVPYEKRLAFWLKEQIKSGEMSKETAIERFVSCIESKISQLEKHFSEKQFDGAGRTRYFNLLRLRAVLGTPKKEREINTLRSDLVGGFLRGGVEREVITLPGFSWISRKLKKGVKWLPNYNTAFAFNESQLHICVSASQSSFSVDPEGKFKYIKTTGGQKRKDSKPKTIENVRGFFDTESRRGVPLFLPLHFGKSHARRYIFNKKWGVFSETPKVFFNNARLKRQKKNPGDEWSYFLDLTLSGERPVGYKKFSNKMLKRAKAVVGIDRGEVVPIAYSVLSLKGEVLDSGVLGEDSYVKRLEEYEEQKRKQQRKGMRISRSLKAKISRLQKTVLETAISQILSRVAKYRAVVAIEDLHRRFKGAERSIIPKRIYVTIEDLLADALDFAGILRIADPNKGHKYWGGLITVNPWATSRTCPSCDTVWLNKSKKKNEKNFVFIAEVLDYSAQMGFSNINLNKGNVEYNGDEFGLNKEWNSYSLEKGHNVEYSLSDLKKALENNTDDAPKLLKGALNHRPRRDIFVCHLCKFSDDADIVAATIIAGRGLKTRKRFLTNK